MLNTWEAWWLDRTNKALRLCTSLDSEPCTHAQLAVTASEVSHDGDSLQPGGKGTIALTISARDRDVDNAVITLTSIDDSAEFVTIEDRVVVGNIKNGADKTVDVDVSFAADYPCGLLA